MSASKTAQQVAAFMLVLACPIAAFLVLKPKPPPAPKLTPAPATFVAQAPDWLASPVSGIPYQWLNQTTFVYQRTDGALSAWDVAPNKASPVDSITRLLAPVATPAAALRFGVQDWELSPNRRFILAYSWTTGRPQWMVLSMDGKYRVLYPTRPQFQPLISWKGDSSGWDELFLGDYGPTIASHALSASDDVRLSIIPHMSDGFYGRPLMVGGIGEDGLLMALLGSNVQNQIQMRLFHTGKPKALVERLHATSPPGMELMEVELSPDCKRLAWVLGAPPSRPQGFSFPFFKRSPSEWTQQLWISSTRSGLLRRIAATSGPLGKLLTNIHYVRWLPDGKRISFENQGVIYTVPAP